MITFGSSSILSARFSVAHFFPIKWATHFQKFLFQLHYLKDCLSHFCSQVYLAARKKEMNYKSAYLNSYDTFFDKIFCLVSSIFFLRKNPVKKSNSRFRISLPLKFGALGNHLLRFRLNPPLAMTSLVDGTVFASFRTDSSLSVHWFDCSFVSGVKWWTYVSSIVMNRRKTSALLLWNIAKYLIKTFSRHCLCSLVRKHGDYLVHSFLMSKFPFNMRCTALFDMPTMSASSHTFSRRSSSTILWIFFTSLGQPLRC